MEWKIGEIRKVNEEWYQCVESSGCALCAFNGTDCDDIDSCEEIRRSDGKSVIFKKLEKVGETYEKRVSDGTFSTFQRYKAYNSVILPKKPYMYCNFIDSTIEIEIKQNKDMKTVKVSKDDLNFLMNKVRYGILPKHTDYEEIVEKIEELFSVEDVKLSNSENIRKNLRKFDIEAAKHGRPVCTRDGRKVRIICFDMIGYRQPIIALVTNSDGNEDIETYYLDGRFNDDINDISDYDLMMAPRRKEGWINVYKSVNPIFKSEAEAKAHNDDYANYIGTFKIEWEE